MDTLLRTAKYAVAASLPICGTVAAGLLHSLAPFALSVAGLCLLGVVALATNNVD